MQNTQVPALIDVQKIPTSFNPGNPQFIYESLLYVDKA